MLPDIPGPLLASYGPPPLKLSRVLASLLLGLAITLTPLVYGAWQAYLAYTQFGPAAAAAWSYPYLILAILAGLVWLLIVLPGSRSPWVQVAVGQNGLLLRWRGVLLFTQCARFIAWEDLQGVSTELISSNAPNGAKLAVARVVLYPAGGHPIKLNANQIQRLAELVTQVKAKVYPRL